MRKNELSEKEIKEIRWRVDAVIANAARAEAELQNFRHLTFHQLPQGTFPVLSSGMVDLGVSIDFALELATLLGMDQDPEIAARIAERRARDAQAEGSRDRFMRDGLL